MQYRLGAFGFLASDDVAKDGALNVGLHDIRFALRWVQKHISRFGGDPDQVTIVGESAGGGSVMLLAIANGGTEGNKLFKRGIASSPFFPTQPYVTPFYLAYLSRGSCRGTNTLHSKFDDDGPTSYYQQFARQAGCLNDTVDPSPAGRKSVFQCLQNADTIVLQKANADVTYNGKYGRWPFTPVTDGELLREQPHVALLDKQVNGERILTGVSWLGHQNLNSQLHTSNHPATQSNANEGALFVPQNISTQSDFEAYVHFNFPRAAAKDMTALLSAYSVPTGFDSPKFMSDGLHPPFATLVSSLAVGWYALLPLQPPPRQDNIS